MSGYNFLSDFKAATNLDFGRDYLYSARNSLNNGNYFSWINLELSATCEIIYDGLFAYNGAKFVDILVKTGLMLNKTLSALSSSSTVVLGRYAEGSCGGYTKMADKLGVSYFQLPDKMFKVLEKINVGNSNLGKIINEKWLDGVMKSGARILLNSNPDNAPKGSAYEMEMLKLKENGYKFLTTCVEGIECWEAVK